MRIEKIISNSKEILKWLIQRAKFILHDKSGLAPYPPVVYEIIADNLLPHIQEFFKKAENMAEYEQWLANKKAKKES